MLEEPTNLWLARMVGGPGKNTVEEREVADGCLRKVGWEGGAAKPSVCVDPLGFLCSHLDYEVLMGEVDLWSSKSVKIPVRDIVVHQDYSVMGTIVHDIALALLAFPVNYSVYIQPVCLPRKSFLVQTGTLCWVTGWGKVIEYGEPKVRLQRMQTRDQTAVWDWSTGWRDGEPEFLA